MTQLSARQTTARMILKLLEKEPLTALQLQTTLGVSRSTVGSAIRVLTSCTPRLIHISDYTRERPSSSGRSNARALYALGDMPDAKPPAALTFTDMWRRKRDREAPNKAPRETIGHRILVVMAERKVSMSCAGIAAALGLDPAAVHQALTALRGVAGPRGKRQVYVKRYAYELGQSGKRTNLRPFYALGDHPDAEKPPTTPRKVLSAQRAAARKAERQAKRQLMRLSKLSSVFRLAAPHQP